MCNDADSYMHVCHPHQALLGLASVQTNAALRIADMVIASNSVNARHAEMTSDWSMCCMCIQIAAGSDRLMHCCQPHADGAESELGKGHENARPCQVMHECTHNFSSTRVHD